MDHRLAHRRKDRLGSGKGRIIAPDHEGQRARIGRRDPARYRRIDHRVRLGRSQIGNRTGRSHVDRRTIDQQGTGRHPFEHIALINRADDLSVGQHGDDDFGFGNGRRDAGMGHASGHPRPFARHIGKVESIDAMPRLRQICRHSAAHVAQADERNAHDILSFCFDVVEIRLRRISGAAPVIPVKPE
jgi:hypothetical protein